MPERNRVTPLGDIVATSLRGRWTGNRGKIHEGHEIVRFHSGDLWLICELEFRGIRQPQWAPHHYTFLFFHDEAVGFAAGHRPCAECRRGSYGSYLDAWTDALGGPRPSAGAVNARLHAERLYPRTHRRRLHERPYVGLPDGAFVLERDTPRLVLGDALVEWSPDGYGPPITRPRSGRATVITPPATLAVLTAGYPVQIDASAHR